MEYKTKYKKGDEVYYINYSEILKGTVDQIKVNDNSKILKKFESNETFIKKDVEIEYLLNNKEDYYSLYSNWKNEKDLYSSERDLINSLS